MSSGSQTTQQTTQQVLTPEQKELVGLALPGFKDFAANPPQLPNFSRVANFDPAQTQGQEAALAAASGPQTDIAQQATQAQTFLTNPDLLHPDSNPFLAATIDAAVRPIQENLVTSTLPAIRSEFAGAGQYGGSRQGIAEGLASRGASQAIADAGASIASEGYGRGLDSLSKGLSLAPTTQTAQVTPALTTSGVGDVRQGQQQAQLAEQASDFNYNQLLDYLVSSDLVSAAAGVPGGAVQSSATGPKQSIFGSALGGASLGSTLGPVLGFGAGPAALGGAGIAALLSLL